MRGGGGSPEVIHGDVMAAAEKMRQAEEYIIEILEKAVMKSDIRGVINIESEGSNSKGKLVGMFMTLQVKFCTYFSLRWGGMILHFSGKYLTLTSHSKICALYLFRCLHYSYRK